MLAVMVWLIMGVVGAVVGWLGVGVWLGKLARAFDAGVRVATSIGKSSKVSTRLVIFLKVVLLGVTLSG
jgi:hypothetical protein